jgi:hypothetical protein
VAVDAAGDSARPFEASLDELDVKVPCVPVREQPVTSARVDVQMGLCGRDDREIRGHGTPTASHAYEVCETALLAAGAGQHRAGQRQLERVFRR